MSPAVDRGTPPEEDYMLSVGASYPTLAAGQEGWLHYRSDEDRWYWWNGTDWLKLAITPIVTDDITDAAVTDVKIADDSVGSLKLKDNAVATAKIQDDSVTLAKLFHGSSGGASLYATSDTGTPELRQIGNAPAYPFVKDLTSSVVWPKASGTTFPTSPVDGQIFTHTTHRCMYYYDAAAGGWLSTAVYEFFFSASIDIAVNVYMAMGMSGTTQFTDTLGPRFGFATKVVGMSLQMAASGTGAVDVWDDGAVVGSSSAQLSLSAQQGKDTDTLMSTTIAAGSVIGVKRTSGTIEGPSLGSVRLRRFET